MGNFSNLDFDVPDEIFVVDKVNVDDNFLKTKNFRENFETKCGLSQSASVSSFDYSVEEKLKKKLKNPSSFETDGYGFPLSIFTKVFFINF